MSGATVESVSTGSAAGAFHRRIRIAPTAGIVSVELEDDFHRLGVRLSHDGTAVTAIEGHAARVPWSTCPEAVSRLQSFVGLCLPASPLTARSALNPYEHCTHLFDLAGLALAHAGSLAETTYDARIEGNADGGCIAILRVNARTHWRWTIADERILDPEPFRGQALKSLPAWAMKYLLPKDQEAAFVLRRALWISRGRWGGATKWKQTTFAVELGLPPTCHSFLPGNAQRARRSPLHVRDFTQDPETLLADSS